MGIHRYYCNFQRVYSIWISQEGEALTSEGLQADAAR